MSVGAVERVRTVVEAGEAVPAVKVGGSVADRVSENGRPASIASGEINNE
jgi:hypothetical protein